MPGFSERSRAKGERLAALMRPGAGALARVLAQTDDDARRLREPGAPRVSGQRQPEVRHDAAARTAGARSAVAPALHRPVVLAASTREGEEDAAAAAWLALPAPRPLLLLVPRHPQRFDEVAALVRAAA